MPSVLHNLPDVTTFAANVVVFLAAIGAAVAGSLSAVKKIKEAWPAPAPPSAATVTTSVVGGLLQDAYGSAMMAEQMRRSNDNMDELCNELREVRITLNRLIDKMDSRRHD